MSVRLRMARGMMWVLLEKVGQQLLGFVVFLIVARLIGPEEFGLAGLCTVFSSFAIFIVFGSVDAVISQQLTDDRRLSTLFWPVIGIGVFLSLLTYFSAAPFAGVMEEERLAGLLRHLAILPFLTAASSVPTVLMQARMEFRLFTVRTLVSTVIGGTVGIVLALRDHGAYALVYQQITQQVVSNLIIWPSARWRPRLMVDGALLGGILAPGIRMTGSTFINFLDTQVPRLLIGLVLGPLHTGYYAFVFRLYFSLREILVLPITSVLYPALAQISRDPENVRRLLGQILYFTAILVLPALVGAAATAPLFVPLFFGDSWTPTVPFLQWFLLAMAPSPFLLVFRELLRAHQKTGAFLRIQLLVTGLNLLVIALLVGRGLVVMTIGMTVTALALFPLAIALTSRASGFRLFPEFTRVIPPILASALMAAGIAGWRHGGLQPGSPWVNLAVVLLLGFLIYTATLTALQFRQLRALSTQLLRLLRQKAVPPPSPA